jgi:hypothetical protein
MLTEAGDPMLTESGEQILAVVRDATAEITVDDLPGQRGIPVFEAGDWVRFSYYGGAGGGLQVGSVWGTVTGYVDNADGTQTWTWDRKDANDHLDSVTIAQNGQAMDYGKSGQGIMRRTVEGENAPFSSVETWTGNPMEGANYDVGVLTGNLDAAPVLPSGTNPTGYGLYGDNVYLSGHVEAQSGLIAGFDIGPDAIIKDYDVGSTLAAGVLGWGSTTGFGFRGGFGEIQIGERGGQPNLLAHTNGSNYVEIGAGYKRSEMGITIMAAGNKVLHTDTAGAYIDGPLVMQSGKIDDPNGNWRLDGGGFKTYTNGFWAAASSFSVIDGSTGRGGLYGDDVRNNVTLESVNGWDVALVSDDQVRIESDDEVIVGPVGGVFAGYDGWKFDVAGSLISTNRSRSSHPAVSPGEVVIYNYNNNGNTELWVARRNEGNGNLNRNKLLD